MELPLISLTTPNSSTAASFGTKLGLCDFPVTRKRRTISFDGARVSVRPVSCSAEQRSSEGINGREAESGGRFTSPAMEVTTLNTSFNEAEYPVWEKIGAVVRLSYGIGELFCSCFIFFSFFFFFLSILSRIQF